MVTEIERGAAFTTSSRALFSHFRAGHSELITAVVISPDGKLVASGSWDGTHAKHIILVGRSKQMYST